jgi:hypothetical protein
MFNLRILNEGDYEVLVKWWKSWRWTAPEKDFLPLNGLGGLMVYTDEVDVVAGFVYTTNSKVAWSEFIISNFEVKDKIIRDNAIKILIQELSRVAKETGAKYIFTTVKNANLVNHYKEMGFTEGSKNTTEMFMLL